MAISYCRMEFVKRSAGKNCVAKSAYNGKLRLEFNGNCVLPPVIYDWAKSKDQNLNHAILLPKHINPEYLDPKILWNLVEQNEKRKDAQVGKEVVLALPDDEVITDKQRAELAHKFAEKYFVSKGYGVQIDVHYPSQHKSYDEQSGELEKNEKNSHAHLLITSRIFSDDGNSFNSKKSNDLSPEIRGSKHFAFGGLEWPKLWTQFQNEYFEEKGLSLRVDQNGVLSQIHLGPVRMRGNRAYEILQTQEKREELGQILLEDSTIILQKLTENKAVFVESDLEIFLQKHLPDNEIDKVREVFWKNSNLVQLFDKDSHQATSKFSSMEVVEEERKILRLSDRIQERPSALNKVGTLPNNLNDEQSVAFKKIIKGSSLSCIEGLAGTGKSYLLVALKNYYEENGYKVRAFGPDNATVKVLQEKGFKNTNNVHRFLFKNHFSKQNAISPGEEVWIVDEAGKLGNRPLAELLKHAEKNNIRLIFSGNSTQLSSVERGGMFKVFCDRYGHAFLGDIQRQKHTAHREISKRLAYGDVSAAVSMIASSGGFVWSKNKDESILRTVEKWADDKINFPYSSSLIIAHTNQEVRQINDLVHTIRQARGEVGEKEFDCKTFFGNIRVSEGDIIEFRSNTKKLKDVFNGQQGVIVSASKNKFVVAIEDKKIVFDPEKFTAFQLGYASTYFRSQGRTVDRAYIVYSSQMHQKLLYVGMTRHVRNAHCFVSRTDASCLMDLKRQVAKKSDVENTLNYTSISEIEKIQKQQHRVKNVQELCNADEFLSRTKGYGLKAWDALKLSVGSFVEHVHDRRSDESFYVVPRSNQEGGGRVVEIKEEKLSLSSKLEKTPENKDSKSQFLPSSALQNVPQDKKILYQNYFAKSENAAALYAIVQTEAAANSVSKESTPSFTAWQKACGERNAMAFDLQRGGVQHKAILGQKGYEILQDRALRHEKINQPKDPIENQLKDNLESLLYKLFPEGPLRRDSCGFRFGSKGSLSVTCVGGKKGCFFDFENKEGGNLFQLIQKKEGLDKPQAIEWARSFLNEAGGKPVPSHFSTVHFSKKKEDNWISLMPSANKRIPSLSSLSSYLNDTYRLTAQYPYYNDQEQLVCYTLRIESKKDGNKIVLPLSYGKFHPESKPTWTFKRYETQNELLYNSTLIKEHPTKPILIVEGEKTTDAAYKFLGKDYVIISWIGGSAAAKNADWKQLFGREVIIWPDNDSAGYKAATDISNCLRKVGVKSLKVVSKEMLNDLPPKWDLADQLPVDKSANFVGNCLLRAESKAIGLDRLNNIAAQHGMTIKQINDVVADIDEKLRPDLEKKHGSKTWEIDAEILKETSKLLQDKVKPVISQSILSQEQQQKENIRARTIGSIERGD